MKFFRQLRKNPIFADLDDKEIEAAFEYVPARVEKRYPRDLIFRPDDAMRELCIILEGNLVEFRIDVGDARKVISSKVDGGMYGIPQCFIRDSKAGNYIAAAMESFLLFVDPAALIRPSPENCAACAKIVANLVRALGEEIRSLRENNAFITIRGMRRKIAKFIYDKYVEQGRSTAVRLGIDRNGMAEYLNVSRPSMSREMIEMREEGIFEFRKDRITVLDAERLRKIAEGKEGK